MSDDDRTVHAEKAGTQLVRYDRQGRWFVEAGSSLGATRMRVGTVQEAASMAVAMEEQGGTIYEGRPGGKQFDKKVAGCRRRGNR
jgi:hypothetical protein